MTDIADPSIGVDESVAARVRAAWLDVLADRIDGPVDPRDTFLGVGGHSLAAARLIARLRAELAVDLSMSTVLRDDPTLDQLVEAVTAQVRARAAAQHSSVPPADRLAGPAAVASADPSSGSSTAPLAPTLRRIWTWHRLHPDSPAYNVVRVVSIAGRVQPAPLRAALADLSARHEALRCGVVELRVGQPEVVLGERIAVPLSVEVVRPAAGDVTSAVDAALYRIANRPFAMATAPLWRVGAVYAASIERTFLILVMHHLIADLRTTDLMLAELATAYGARTAGTAPRFATAAPSLLAHLLHEAQVIGTSKWQDDLAWWSRTLAGASSATPLPLSATDRDERIHEASTHTVEVGPADSDAMDGALRSHSLTPALHFLTAASSVLAAWSGQDRAEIVGLPSARVSRPEDERLVGFLLDTLPLPVSPGRENSYLTTYRELRDAYADAADHALPAFDDVVDRLRLPRGVRSPLIRLWFNDLTQAVTPATFGGLDVVEYDLPPGWALFDLGLYVWRSPAGYRLHLVSPHGLFEPADTAALLAQIVRTAVRAAADPSRALGELLQARAAATAPNSTIESVASTSELVRHHARHRRTGTAVVDEDGALDYQSLDAEIEAAAAQLREAAEPVPIVALPARRDRRFLVRLVACWRAGVTAVLVDAGWPAQRRRRALEIAGATRGYPWFGDGPSEAFAEPAGPTQIVTDGAAHVLFTSGTTGDPLAVLVPTPVAEVALADLGELLELRADDRVSMLSGPAHDPVLRDLGLALRAGATVCLPPAGVFGHPGQLAAWLRRERVTVVSATPALLALVFSADEQPLPDLRAVVCGGSPLSAATAELVRQRAGNAIVVNGYGSTETPQLVVAYEIAAGKPPPPTVQVPIGDPLPGRRVEVVAADGRRCDVGQVGELWVAEPHIARGYLNGGADRFVTDDSGLRWFRTGDLARRDAAGRLHLAGRTDRQVLVNGYRVNLEELESTARGCAGVSDAVAQVVDDGGRRQAVRVWVQRSANSSVGQHAVRDHLMTVLPASAMPARVIVVDRLEVGETLKPVAPRLVPAAMAAGSRPDARLHQLAESVLGRPLDPATNFFDAGFTSVLLLQLSTELSETLGRPVEALSLFDHPNLRALSAFLHGSPAEGSPVDGSPVAGSPVDELTARPGSPAASRLERVAQMGAHRRQVRTWIRESTGKH